MRRTESTEILHKLPIVNEFFADLEEPDLQEFTPQQLNSLIPYLENFKTSLLEGESKKIYETLVQRSLGHLKKFSKKFPNFAFNVNFFENSHHKQNVENQKNKSIEVSQVHFNPQSNLIGTQNIESSSNILNFKNDVEETQKNFRQVMNKQNSRKDRDWNDLTSDEQDDGKNEGDVNNKAQDQLSQIDQFDIMENNDALLEQIDPKTSIPKEEYNTKDQQNIQSKIHQGIQSIESRKEKLNEGSEVKTMYDDYIIGEKIDNRSYTNSVIQYNQNKRQDKQSQSSESMQSHNLDSNSSFDQEQILDQYVKGSTFQPKLIYAVPVDESKRSRKLSHQESSQSSYPMEQEILSEQENDDFEDRTTKKVQESKTKLIQPALQQYHNYYHQNINNRKRKEDNLDNSNEANELNKNQQNSKDAQIQDYVNKREFR